MRTTGFAIKERIEVAGMIQTYCVKHIKRYEQMKNKTKSVRTQPVRPVSGLSEIDKVYDQDMILSMKLLSEEIEEGEIREEEG